LERSANAGGAAIPPLPRGNQTLLPRTNVDIERCEGLLLRLQELLDELLLLLLAPVTLRVGNGLSHDAQVGHLLSLALFKVMGRGSIVHRVDRG